MHATWQLLGNSQTCSRPFNEVVELSVGVLSLAALHENTPTQRSLVSCDKNNNRIALEKCKTGNYPRKSGQSCLMISPLESAERPSIFLSKKRKNKENDYQTHAFHTIVMLVNSASLNLPYNLQLEILGRCCSLSLSLSVSLWMKR